MGDYCEVDHLPRVDRLLGVDRSLEVDRLPGVDRPLEVDRPLFNVPSAYSSSQASIISKITSTSAKSAFDFLRRPFSWLSRVAASGSSKSVAGCCL